MVITCRRCQKRFRIRLNSKLGGLKLEEGYQTTCPYCGYVIYIGDVNQARYLLFWTRILLVLMASFLGMNARLLVAQERFIAVGVGTIVLMFAIHHLSLWVAGKLYDKLSK